MPEQQVVKTPIYKTKTFWAGVGLIASGAAGYLTGDATVMETVQTVGTGLLGIFLRTGLIKIPQVVNTVRVVDESKRDS